MPTRSKRRLRNLARRLARVEPGVAGSISVGLEEILTVIRLGHRSSGARSAMPIDA